VLLGLPTASLLCESGVRLRSQGENTCLKGSVAQPVPGLHLSRVDPRSHYRSLLMRRDLTDFCPNASDRKPPNQVEASSQIDLSRKHSRSTKCPQCCLAASTMSIGSFLDFQLFCLFLLVYFNNCRGITYWLYSDGQSFYLITLQLIIEISIVAYFFNFPFIIFFFQFWHW
jgi:hypothetical protein